MSIEKRRKSDLHRLMQAISALSAAPDNVTRDGRLLISPDGVAIGLFEALLTEVNETVLHRRLIFRSENNSRLVLEVSERRILQAQCLALDDVGEDNTRARSYLTNEDATDLYQTLSEFARSSKTMRVLSELPETSVQGAVEGVSIKAIRQFEQVGSDIDCLAKPFGVLLEETKNLAIACVTDLGNGELTCWGPDAECSALRMLFLETAADTGLPDIFVWSSGLKNNVSVARVATANEILLAVLSQRSLGAFLRLWKPGSYKTALQN